jgi:hypothetical protein
LRCFRFFFLSLVVLVSAYYSGCSKSPTTPDQATKPYIISFTATPPTVKYKESSILSWSVANAISVFIDPGVGTVESNGSKEVSLAETITYSLGATNAAGASYKTCTVTVDSQARFELVSYKKEMVNNDWCLIVGIVRNIGDMPGYNVRIHFTAYDSNNTILDTAIGYPTDLYVIPVNTSATFEANFYSIHSWSKIARLTYVIEWWNGEGKMSMRQGTIS